MARANTVGFLKALCFNQFERKTKKTILTE